MPASGLREQDNKTPAPALSIRRRNQNARRKKI
jgi:hypothetical protein